MILTHLMMFIAQTAVEIVPASVLLPVAAGPSAITPSGSAAPGGSVLRVRAVSVVLRVSRP